MESKTQNPGKRRITRLERALNRLLAPVEIGYRVFSRVMKKTQSSVPFVYNEVESLVRSQLIGLDKDKNLVHNPDLDTMTEIVAESVMQKIPNVDKAKLREIIENNSSKSFLDMLTRGLGTTIEAEKDYTVLKDSKLFRRILIANRGEIAVRVLRACKELGIESVVVYTKPDKDSLAVRFADKSYCLGSAASYLDPKKIIAIAKKTKADAVHPGYGFLAENAEFAMLCQKSRITFIGPKPSSITLLGDKVRARQSMIKAGVPVLAGTSSLKNSGDALIVAEKIGFPVIIKATAGGGGKGMRIVYKKEELVNAYNSAQLEAENSFGSSEVFIEKYAENPRHIEFQILADNYGNVIHLGERECSIQRRHQKLVEEAPSPALDRRLRKEMGEAAVKAISAVGYQGAGTVEFLIDTNKRFYFIEMNTRIQVEHGITEMITGVDLVKEQIKIASGALLAYRQEDIKMNGWAIECRINAECPDKGFCPDIGTINNYLPPGGPGIRVCSSCHTGHIVSPHYDSLIAKLICGGKTRSEAIARMKRALDEYIIEGVNTTIPFHRAVLTNKQFVKGNTTTNFIEEQRILDKVRQAMPKKKELAKKERAIIISTAVSEYIRRRRASSNGHPGNWAMAGRQELMQDFNET